MKVLAFDPGETTGYCVLDDGTLSGGSFPMWSEVPKLIKGWVPTVIVCEDFVLYPKKARYLIYDRFKTVKVIGVIEYVASLHDIPVVLQMASLGKSIKLRRIGGLSRHAHDATRHAIYYANRNGFGQPYLRYQAGSRKKSAAQRAKEQELRGRLGSIRRRR